MKILITGGAGFIGSHIADELWAQGHEIFIVDNFVTGQNVNLQRRKKLTVIEGTIANEALVRRSFERCRPDIVVHAAASYKTPNNWNEDSDTNVKGTANVVRYAQEENVKRLIYFQTSLCYGLQPLEQPITLAHPIISEGSSYAITKTAGENFVKLSGLDWLSFRLANVYGPRNLTGPLPTFYRRLTSGQSCFVMNTRRDFLYIKDLVEVITKAVSGIGRSGIYHIATGQDFSIRELFEASVEALGITPKGDLHYCARGEDDVDTILLDPTVTQKEFDWKAIVSLRDGVRAAVDYYRDFGIEQTFTHLESADPYLGKRQGKRVPQEQNGRRSVR